MGNLVKAERTDQSNQNFAIFSPVNLQPDVVFNMNNLIVKILDHMETNMRNNIGQYELQCENPDLPSFCEKPF